MEKKNKIYALNAIITTRVSLYEKKLVILIELYARK